MLHRIIQTVQTASVYDLTTVEQANAFLNLTSTPEGDAALAAEITAASKIIATQCDRNFAMEEVSEIFVLRFGECAQSLSLDRPPVISVASVDNNGQLLNENEYDIDYSRGILWRRVDGWGAWPYWYWQNGGRITVTYTGGYDLPTGAPADLTLACHALIKEQRFSRLRGDPTIRSVQHGDLAVFYQQGSTAFAIGQGALPPAVAQLIAPYKIPAYA